MDIDYRSPRNVTSLRTTWKRYHILRCYSVLSVFSIAKRLTFILLIGILFPTEGLSQSQLLTGKTVDSRTGQSLSAVDVRLGQKTTTSDTDGRFAFRGVLSGDHSIVARAPGYERLEQMISVSADDTTSLTLQLQLRFAEGDTMFVQQRRHRQSQALSRQKNRGFTSVLSSPQIERFGDYSVEEALRRVPGAQTLRDGEINLRGAGLNRYYVMLDGQRLASTGSGTRSVDLGAISADMIRDIEVINVLQPDMDADGIGGAVNLITRRPAGGQRELEIRMGGGANTEYFNRLGVANRFSVDYSEPLLDELTLTVGLSRQKEYDGWESLGIQYDAADFGSGPVDVLERVSPGLEADSRGRWGGRLQLTWEPDSQTRYFFRGMINMDNKKLIGHSNQWIANGNWESQSLSGAQGLFGYDLNLNETDTQIYTFKAGGDHIFGLLNLSYGAGWTYGQVNSTRYRFPFRATGIQHELSLQDRNRPLMEMVDTPLRADNLRLQSMDNIIDNHIENKFTGNIDVEFPFSFGSVKVGSKASLAQKDALEEGAYSEYLYTFRGSLYLDSFELTDENPSSVFDGVYPLPWTADGGSAEQFFETNIPNMLLDEELFHERSDIFNYNATENIYAGYGMATFGKGKFYVSAGARVEYTDAEYTGRIVEYNRFDRHQETNDTTLISRYTDLFPNARLRLDLDPDNSIQIAYSRSISRPDFNQLAPFNLIKASDTTLIRGNHNLEPVYSDNFDFSYERYLPTGGAIILGLFYKEISNFISARENSVTVQEGDFNIFDPLFSDEITSIQARETQFRNRDEAANLYGIEVSWQQFLTFIPSRFGQFGTYLNYTWTQSDFDTDRDEEVNLPGQSPHVLNAALDYTFGRFTSQFSYHYTASALRSLQATQTLAPPISQQEVYLDSYVDGWTDLSVTLRYRISKHVRFWTDIYNLLGTEQLQYAELRSDYPTNIRLREGTEFRFGVRFNL